MPQIGDVLGGNYEITGKIGSGGGGIIFKANHLRMRKTVALKLIKENVKGIIENRAEVDILKNLKNDYLPQVLDFVEDNDDVYTVMEYIEGQDLHAIVQSGKRFDEKSVMKYASQLCSAVEYLHSQNPPIIHSDIKPANIMLTPDDKICLIDFNISLITNGDGAYSRGGSKGFAAPEQFRKIIDAPISVDAFHEQTRFISSDNLSENPNNNDTTVLIGETTELIDEETELLSDENQANSERKVLTAKTKDISKAYIDTRTDIYGIGTSLYYIVTSRLPVGGNLDFRGIKISKKLRRIIEKATAQNPDDRYKSVSEMKKDIESNGTVKLNLKVLIAVSAAIVAVVATIIIYPIIRVEMNTRALAYSYGNEFVIEKAYNKELMGKRLSNKYNATAVSLMQQAYNYYYSLGFEECSKYIAISQDVVDNIEEKYNLSFGVKYKPYMEVNKLDPGSGDFYEYLLNNFTNYTGKDELYIFYSISDGKFDYMYVSDDSNLYEAAMNGVAIQGNLGAATTTSVNDVGISEVDSLILDLPLSLDSIFSNNNQESGTSNEKDESDTNSKDTADNQPPKDDTSTPEHNYEPSPLLSDNLFDFHIQINDTVYQFPLTVEEFMSYGWQFGKYENPDVTIDSYFDDLVNVEYKDGSKWIIGVINFSKSALPLTDCYVGRISCTGASYDGFDNTYVAIAKGIELCKATEADIRAAYGEPTEEYVSSTSKYLTYSLDSYVYVKLVIRSNVLIGIEVCNYVIPDDFVDSELRDEIPEFVTNYKEPQNLGFDVLSQIIQLDGDLYTMPFPVKAALDNGWTMDEESLNQTIQSGGYTHINLEKDGYRLDHIIVENPCDYEIDVIYGAVTSFSIYSSNKIPFELPCGIKLGMTISELEQALSNTDFTKDEGAFGPRYYIALSAYNNGSVKHYISIYTDQDTISLIDINLFDSF